nr:site-specific DNA-methyltransferase [Actinomycetota bacterium]
MRNRSENLLKYAAPEASRRYTHYLFRYPAKFHPPVAQALLERYTEPGDCVLDCFCGSGTLLVEATVAGRSAVGSDVDPVAAFVSRVKARP